MKKEAIYNFLDKMLKLGFAFLISVFASRILSKDEFGMFLYITMVSSSCLVMIGGGWDTQYTKRISEDKSININLMLGYLLLRFIIALPLATLAVFHLYFKFNLNELEVTMLIIVTIILFISVAEQTFIALIKNKLMLKVTVLFSLVFFIIKISAIYYYEYYIYKFLLDGIEVLVVFLVSIFFIRKALVHKIKLREVIRYSKDIVISAYPLWFNCVVMIIYSRIDQVYVASIGNNSDIAEYGIAVNLNSLALILPTSLMTVYFPKMVSLYSSDRTKYQALVKSLIKISICYGLIWFLTCNVAGEWIVTNIYGTKYSEAAGYLSTISIATIFIVLGQVFGQHMVILDKYWVALKRSLMGIFITIISYIICGDEVSIEIIAIIMVINTLFVNVIMYLFLKESKDIRYFMGALLGKGSNEYN